MEKGLFSPGNRKQSQVGSVQNHDDRGRNSLGDALHKQSMHEEHDRTARESRGSVAPIAQGTGRGGADQEIANDAAGQGCGKREHHKAQKIEISRNRGGSALDTEEERPGQIDSEEKSVRVVFHEGRNGILSKPVGGGATMHVETGAVARPAGQGCRCRCPLLKSGVQRCGIFHLLQGKLMKSIPLELKTNALERPNTPARSVMAVIAWFVLGLQFYLMVTRSDAQGAALWRLIVNYFSFFTILTNLLIAVGLTWPLAAPDSGGGKLFSQPAVTSATAVYIAIVGVTYSLLLRPARRAEGGRHPTA